MNIVLPCAVNAFIYTDTLNVMRTCTEQTRKRLLSNILEDKSCVNNTSNQVSYAQDCKTKSVDQFQISSNWLVFNLRFIILGPSVCLNVGWQCFICVVYLFTIKLKRGYCKMMTCKRKKTHQTLVWQMNFAKFKNSGAPWQNAVSWLCRKFRSRSNWGLVRSVDDSEYFLGAYMRFSLTDWQTV